MIGRIIGNYRITSELAHGGMGTVYRGQHVHLPREIVVKSILLSAFSPSAQSHLKARFRREAYIQSQLDHPNIVRVYEFFAAEDNYYMVMEYVPGMSLRDLLSRQGVPTPAQAVYLCKQALSALEFAHNFSYVDESDIRHTGIIHRDIKPANILLDNKGKLKITDFGIVKVMGEPGNSGGMTQTGFHPGTVEYMSPEQLLGLDIDVRSDLYSLGVTFYEMLSGRLPFVRSATGSDWEVRKGHIEMSPPPILELRPDLPPTLAAIIMRSLQKSPNERFQTATEFLEALQIHDRTVGETLTRGTTGRLTKPITPQPTLLDEAATLIAKPTNSKPLPSPSPAVVPTDWPSLPSSGPSSSTGSLSLQPNALIEEAATMPMTRGANSAGPMGQPAPPSSNPTNEETVIAARHGSSKGRMGLAAAGIGLLLAGTAAGSYLFSGQRKQDNSQIVAVKVEPSATPTPVPSVSPTPKPTVKPKPSPAVSTGTSVSPAPVASEAGALLRQAQALEDKEQYAEALARYIEYQSRNPNAADSALVTTRINLLNTALRFFAEAQAYMQAGQYPKAKERYRALLRMKPTSQIARAGFEEANSKSPDNPLGRQPNRGVPPNAGEMPPRGPNRQRRPPNQIPEPRVPEKP